MTAAVPVAAGKGSPDERSEIRGNDRWLTGCRYAHPGCTLFRDEVLPWLVRMGVREKS